jgi:hypothetical protein
VPPDVVTGFVVVVVGAVVVVVVVLLEVVVVAFVWPLPDEDSGSLVLVVVVLDDVEVLAVLPEGCPAVVREDGLCVVLPPGCSVATTRPIATVAPVAPRIAPRVRRRSRTRALAVASCGLIGLVPMPIGSSGLADGYQETMSTFTLS